MGPRLRKEEFTYLKAEMMVHLTLRSQNILYVIYKQAALLRGLGYPPKENSCTNGEYVWIFFHDGRGRVYSLIAKSVRFCAASLDRRFMEAQNKV
jgi:hypothetical protein